MITRRDFICKGAALAGALLGSDRIVVLAQSMTPPGPTGPYVIRTSLEFPDVARINRVLAEVDAFASADHYGELSRPFYRNGMTVEDFTRRYVRAVRAAYPLPSSGSAGQGRPHPMAVVARHCDAHLALLSKLFVMMGNEVLAGDCRARMLMNTAAQANEFNGRYRDLHKAALHIAEQWRLRDFSFVFYRGEGRLRTVVQFYPGGPRIAVEQAGAGMLKNFLADPYTFRTNDGASLNRAIALVEAEIRDINAGRASWKAVYSAYSLLSILESECRAQSAGAESMNGIAISQGARQFVNKVQLGFLFVEIVLTRLRLLAHQSRSTIFTGENRACFQKEVTSLVEIIDTGLRAVRFGGIGPFDGRFASSPATMRLDGRYASVRVPDIGTGALRLKTAGAQSITVSSINGTISALRTCDEAIETVRLERARLYAALEGK
ncbi:MAG: hypothetical protein KBA61_11835 [Spirochaetes bacterium]|nr:hypothetical protein [Spirochaetota bacterium]